MRHFTTTELARMQGLQESAMQDTCVVLTHQANTGDYGYGVPGYASGVPIPCGFNPKAREVMGDTEIALTDGSLRLPLNTAVTNLDRVILTHRFDVQLVPGEVYEIMGVPERGPSGLRLNLRVVTDGSG